MATVQFILGRSGTGKSHRCIDVICQALRSDGAEPLVLLVPEQATYQAERMILSQPDIAGFSRLRILSFNRLQFWLNPAPTAAAEISTAGKQMILHKLLLDLAGELTVYKGDIQRRGLAGKLAELLAQFQHSNCSAKQVALLTQKLSQTPGQELAAAKWADIAKVYTAYESYFQNTHNTFVNPDAELSLAKDKVASSAFLQDARIWVDGFSGFSGQERDLLIELLRVSSNAAIALCLDPGIIDINNDDEDKLDPCSLFASTEQTYCQLLRIIRGCKLPLDKPIILDKPRRFDEIPALAKLESNLASDRAAETMVCEGAIQIAACSNVRAETMWVAQQIRSLVNNDRYRYRDIAVVVPEMESYRHYITSAFAQYGLPYFLDRPQVAKTHPVTELIGSALQAVMGGFAQGDVLSYLKSPLSRVDFEKVDPLENYCRAHDVQGAEWLRKAVWDFADPTEKDHYKESQMDTLRRQVIKPLKELQVALNTEDTITAAQFTQAVWHLLSALEVPNTLAQWAADDVTDQQFGHRQLYGRMIELMDELCKVFENIELKASAWAAILTDAMAGMTVKLIPPTLDQVLVGSIERSRHPDIKAIFLVGATQKQFPTPVMNEMLLSETDYKLADEAQMDLADPYQQQLTHRQYLAYIALTRASKKIYLTYPRADEKGSVLVPWSGIEQLGTMFSDLEVMYPSPLPQAPEQIQSLDELSQWLCSRLGKDRSSEDDPVAAGILQLLGESEDDVFRKTAQQIRGALAYDNAAAISDETAAKAFTFPLKTSVTRLGTFAKCPYQHFAKYTLGLQRRQLVRFEPMDVGTFYHDVLEALFKALQECGCGWADLQEAELLALCDKQIDKVIAENTQLGNFMRRKAHHEYIIKSAKAVIRSFVPALAQLSKASRFKQAQAELAFGPSEDMRFVIPLDKQRSIEFSGRIDRLDTADIDGQTAALVFDYKSSGKSVDFAGILYGLDLQLPVYLLAMRGANEGTAPAGAFFLPIDKGTTHQPLSALGTLGQSFNKAKGLFDGGFFEAIDTKAAASGGRSQYYNYYVNKDGTPYSYYKTSGVLKPADFQALLDYTQGCIKKLAEDLAAGNIGITPYRIGTSSPCSWCDYRALCRFDWQINDYRLLDPVNKEQVIDKIKQ